MKSGNRSRALLLPVAFHGQNTPELRKDGILWDDWARRSRACSIPRSVQGLVGLGAAWDCPMGWDLGIQDPSDPTCSMIPCFYKIWTKPILEPSFQGFQHLNPIQTEFSSTVHLPFFPLNPRFLLKKIPKEKISQNSPVQIKMINSGFAPCCDSQRSGVHGNHLQHHLGASQGFTLMDFWEKSIFGLVFSSR